MIESLTSVLRLNRVSLWDLVDILIVGLLIYEVLKLIRRAHAVQILIGVGLVVGLY